MELVRLAGPALAALGAALLVDRLTRRRRLDPPGFAEPLRRTLAVSLVAFTFYVGVFSALSALGQTAPATDFSALGDWQLFTLQFLFVFTLFGWFALGFAGAPGGLAEAGEGVPETAPVPLRIRFAQQFGFATKHPWREIGLGVVAGVAAWLAVILFVLAFAMVFAKLFGEEFLPQEPPEAIPWIAGRSVLLRLAIAISAGLVEETFFRGFLQPRVGIAFSTFLFAFAHLSYDQPMMLVGITALSLFYGALVRWRRNLWPSIVAHFLFDAIQLLIVIPAVLRLIYKSE